ncbi:hypothetical protein ECZU31_18030 [Escherichia coli]|nr:hypothetical protein ECZU31_18030 [Escherichia coli]
MFIVTKFFYPSKIKAVEFNKTYSLADCKRLQNVFIKTLPEIAIKLLQLNEEDSEWLRQISTVTKALLILSLVYFTSGGYIPVIYKILLRQ